MASPKWGNWFVAGTDGGGGEIPDDRLPAAWIQYYWDIDTTFDIPGSWGFSGGRMSIDFDIQISDAEGTPVFTSHDHFPAICETLFGMYEYIPGNPTMSAFPSVPHLGEGGPYYVTLQPDDTGGMGQGYIRGELYSPMYQVAIPAGATVDVLHWTPQTEMMGGFALWMRTALGGGVTKRMAIDPVTGDEYLPAITSGMLTMRVSSWDGMSGRRAGLGVSYAGGVATVQAGHAVIGHQDCYADSALTANVPTTGTYYVFLAPAAGGLSLLVGTGPQQTPAWCVGRVKNGAFAACDGVLIADGTDACAVDRREDGLIVVRYDSGTQRDLRAVSRNRGVTWV